MKVLIFLASFLLVACAFSKPHEDVEEWKAYKVKYIKSYSEEEDKFRMNVFMDKKRKIAEHNARYEKGEVTYTLGVNQFSDMLYTELSSKFNGYNITGTFKKTQDSTFIPPANVEIPDEVDWTKKGAVNRVKEQGECGASWTFSAVGALESHHFIKTGKMVSLSEQNLVDCAIGLGCQGGLIEMAYVSIRLKKGIDTEESYPYVGKEQTCRFNPETVGATVTNFTTIAYRNETAMEIALANVGPLNIGIDGDTDSFIHYSGGIYSDTNCDSVFWNHALLLVGYGTDKATNKKYWLIKNSWGESWGEKGYIRMSRDEPNICGIANYVMYPVI